MPVPLTMGPPLPGERSSTSAPTIAGVTPRGDALAVTVAGGDHLTLLAFLSSGCATCAGFWQAFRTPGQLGLSPRTRLVVVTKGPELEIPGEVAAHGRRRVCRWSCRPRPGATTRCPGSPFFVLVDGASGRRIGEGVANHFRQVVELVRRAESDARVLAVGSRSRGLADGLDGPERELDNDRELMAAGILPGDPSLYPASLDDVHGRIPPRPRGESADLPPISQVG